MMNTAAREALHALREGNMRFVTGAAERPRQDAGRRRETALGQRPFAAIVACSDSRVSPEIIFDQGIGDVFVVRSAGNLLDRLGIGSIEYAVDHLHVPLVVVLAHSRCGAVAAAVAEATGAPGAAGGADASGDHAAGGCIPAVLEMIRPAVERSRGLGGELAETATRENARAIARRLASTQPIIARAAGAGSLAIASAYYDVSSGVVSFDGE